MNPIHAELGLGIPRNFSANSATPRETLGNLMRMRCGASPPSSLSSDAVAVLKVLAPLPQNRLNHTAAEDGEDMGPDPKPRTLKTKRTRRSS